MGEDRYEAAIEAKACQLVWQHLAIKGSKLKVLGERAFPDRIFWIPGGRPLLIEFKRPGHEPTVAQLKNHAYLRGLGYNVEVHDEPIAAFDAVIRAVEASRVPEASGEILARARSVCALLRPRPRQD